MVTSSTARRVFNDDRLRLFGGGNRVVAFVCECSDPGCTKTILLPARDYEARRDEGPLVHEAHAASPAGG